MCGGITEHIRCMFSIRTITCVCQSTGKLPPQWSTVTPHRHWSSWWDKGGTNASAACDWTSDVWFMQVQEACSKFSSWMGRLRSVSCICDTAGSQEKATDHGKNDLNLDVTCYQKAATSLVLLFALPLRRRRRFPRLLDSTGGCSGWKFCFQWLT